MTYGDKVDTKLMMEAMMGQFKQMLDTVLEPLHEWIN